MKLTDLGERDLIEITNPKEENKHLKGRRAIVRRPWIWGHGGGWEGWDGYDVQLLPPSGEYSFELEELDTRQSRIQLTNKEISLIQRSFIPPPFNWRNFIKLSPTLEAARQAEIEKSGRLGKFLQQAYTEGITDQPEE